MTERRALTKKQKAEICLRQQGKCNICRMHLMLGQIIYDHANPLELSGDNSMENFQALCTACDKIKTNGKHQTSYGSDQHQIKKANRLARGGKKRGPAPKSRTEWPKGRKLQSRSSFR